MAFLKIDNQINLIPIYIYSTVHIQLLLLPLPPTATEPPRPTALPHLPTTADLPPPHRRTVSPSRR
jgi:hypothetical protein